MIRFFGFLIIAGVISSCVSNKKIQYLQKDDVNVENVILDSIIRDYQTNNFEYKVQKEDVLSVRVESLTKEEFDIFSYGRPQQTNQTFLANGAGIIFGELVDENGQIEFPVIGKITVEGLSIFEIQDKIQNIANGLLNSPVIKVRLLNFRFTILGEVNNEGTITTYNNRVSFFEGLGYAGGLSDMADRSKVKIVRNENGTLKVFYINLLEEEYLKSNFYYLHQGDIIIVPPLKQRPFRTYFGQNLGLVLSSLSTLLLIINLLND